MSKKIEFEKNGEKYILEYNRKSIELLEGRGFSVEDMFKKPMTMLPLAFEGLFYKNHKRVKREFVDECYDCFENKEKLAGVIADMLTETYDTLTSDNEDSSKNIEWKIVG